MQHTAVVRTDGDSQPGEICRIIRHGCLLSLLDLYRNDDGRANRRCGRRSQKRVALEFQVCRRSRHVVAVRENGLKKVMDALSKTVFKKRT